MRILKPLLLVAVILVGLVAAGWYALGQMQASVGYTVRVEFASLPEDDSRFEEWMRSQPGVVTSTFHVARYGKSMHVSWIMVQTIGSREPPVPDYLAAFEHFGYTGAANIRYGNEPSGE
jgi:hypothetical protein